MTQERMPRTMILDKTNVLLSAQLTCPQCSNTVTEKMPENYCLYFWDCPNCSAQITPKKGDCCVFCSYADQACPPMQQSHQGTQQQTCCE